MLLWLNCNFDFAFMYHWYVCQWIVLINHLCFYAFTYNVLISCMMPFLFIKYQQQIINMISTLPKQCIFIYSHHLYSHNQSGVWFPLIPFIFSTFLSIHFIPSLMFHLVKQLISIWNYLSNNRRWLMEQIWTNLMLCEKM